MTKVGIIGAGHAGVAAASALADSVDRIVLFSDENFLPYFRPSIPAVAFNHKEESAAVIKSEEWYTEKNIELKLNSEVYETDENCRVLLNSGEKYFFDKLIFTNGARPVLPPFCINSNPEKVIPLWDMSGAVKVKRNLNSAEKVTIIGGGIIGIEAAMRAVDAGLNAAIIEMMPHLMLKNFGESASTIFENILRSKGIEIYTDQAVTEINEEGVLSVKTKKGYDLNTDFVLLSIGAKMNKELAENLDLKTESGVLADKYLQTSKKNIFVAGDTAQLPGCTNACSALRATKQGKIAGPNVIASEDSLKEYKPIPLTVQFKYKDFELYAVGKTPNDEGCKEEILECNKDKNLYRTLVKDSQNNLVGVQMINSHQDFRKYEAQMKESF